MTRCAPDPKLIRGSDEPTPGDPMPGSVVLDPDVLEEQVAHHERVLSGRSDTLDPRPDLVVPDPPAGPDRGRIVDEDLLGLVVELDRLGRVGRLAGIGDELV